MVPRYKAWTKRVLVFLSPVVAMGEASWEPAGWRRVAAIRTPPWSMARHRERWDVKSLVIVSKRLWSFVRLRWS